jgi:hypothetical protein
MYKAYYEILKNTSALQSTIENTNAGTCANSLESISEESLNLGEESKTTETISDVLIDDSVNEIATPAETSSMAIANEYALFIESYTNKSSAKKSLDALASSLDENMKSKVVSNKNGTFTATICNINGKSQAIAIKNKLNSKYPNSYYVKKKNK